MARLALTREMADAVLYASERVDGHTLEKHVNITRDALRDRHNGGGRASAATAFISVADAAVALAASINSLQIAFVSNFNNMPDGRPSGDLHCDTGLQLKCRYGGGECKFVTGRFFLVMNKRVGMPHSLFVLKIYPEFT